MLAYQLEKDLFMVIHPWSHLNLFIVILSMWVATENNMEALTNSKTPQAMCRLKHFIPILTRGTLALRPFLCPVLHMGWKCVKSKSFLEINS